MKNSCKAKPPYHRLLGAELHGGACGASRAPAALISRSHPPAMSPGHQAREAAAQLQKGCAAARVQTTVRQRGGAARRSRQRGRFLAARDSLLLRRHAAGQLGARQGQRLEPATCRAPGGWTTKH